MNTKANKLSISNLAWNEEREFEILPLLRQTGFTGVEIAPYRIAKDWKNPDEVFIDKYIAATRASDMEICSFQGIFFNSEPCHLFKSEDLRKTFVKHMELVIRLASRMDVKNLVFGSPGLRTLQGRSIEQATNIAAEVFNDINRLCCENDVTIALEANPAEYGCEFLTHTEQVLDFVRLVNLPFIKANLDLGTVAINREDPLKIVKHLKQVNHVHISSPELRLINTDKIFHNDAAAHLKLKTHHYAGWVSVEMLKPKPTLDMSILTETREIASKYLSDWGTA